MKQSALCLMLAVIAMGASTHLFAQTVEFISVEKVQDFVRNKDGVSERPFIPEFQSAPFQFRIDVEGTGLGSLATPTFAIPGGSYTAATGDPSGHYQLTYSDGEWGRRFSFPNKWIATGGPPSMTGEGGLDGFFHNGEYTVTAGGTSVSLQLGGDANVDVYPNAPTPTVSAGTWDNSGISRLFLNPNQALTINTGTFADFGSGDYLLSGIGLYISSGGTDIFDKTIFSEDLHGFLGFEPGDWINANFLEYAFGEGSLVAGTEYFVSMEFFTVTDFQTIGALDDALAVALFTSRTEFSISVVPEPSTYAAIFGVVALVGVVVVRRRQAAAA